MVRAYEIANKDYDDRRQMDQAVLDDHPTWMLFMGRVEGTYRTIASAQIVPTLAGLVPSIRNYVLEEHEKELAEHEKRRAEQALADAKAESKRKFDEFVRHNGVVTWPPGDGLASNPFKYEGQVVGLRASFAKMLSRSTALFKGTDLEMLVVEGVPSTLLSGGEDVLVAARVKGLTDGAINLEYVGVHVCSDRQCSDLLSWVNDLPPSEISNSRAQQQTSTHPY